MERFAYVLSATCRRPATRRGSQSEPSLYCIECGFCSGALGKGWVAMRRDHPDPDMGDEPAVAFNCPPCAAGTKGDSSRPPALDEAVPYSADLRGSSRATGSAGCPRRLGRTVRAGLLPRSRSRREPRGVLGELPGRSTGATVLVTGSCAHRRSRGRTGRRPMVEKRHGPFVGSAVVISHLVVARESWAIRLALASTAAGRVHIASAKAKAPP